MNSYFLCEKSDGIRCLLLFTRDHSNPSTPEAHYLIDRKNNYYHVPSLHFPRAPDPGHETNFSSYHYDTILDGELLYDTYPTGERILKYLVFDCLVIDGHNICSNTLDKRVAHFYEKILKPYEELWTRFREDCEAQFAFRIQRKSTERAYGTEMMFRDVIPRLKHGSDGLIFTCRETPYKFGTDENILKWKPAEENSIDFKMDLEFPRVVEAYVLSSVHSLIHLFTRLPAYSLVSVLTCPPQPTQRRSQRHLPPKQRPRHKPQLRLRLRRPPHLQPPHLPRR